MGIVKQCVILRTEESLLIQQSIILGKLVHSMLFFLVRCLDTIVFMCYCKHTPFTKKCFSTLLLYLHIGTCSIHKNDHYKKNKKNFFKLLHLL